MRNNLPFDFLVDKEKNTITLCVKTINHQNQNQWISLKAAIGIMRWWIQWNRILGLDNIC